MKEKKVSEIRSQSGLCDLDDDNFSVEIVSDVDGRTTWGILPIDITSVTGIEHHVNPEVFVFIPSGFDFFCRLVITSVSWDNGENHFCISLVRDLSGHCTLGYNLVHHGIEFSTMIFRPLATNH